MSNEHIINRKILTITLLDGKPYKISPVSISGMREILPVMKRFVNLKNTTEISDELFEDITKIMAIALKGQIADDSHVVDLVSMADLGIIISFMTTGQVPLEAETRQQEELLPSGSGDLTNDV